MKWIGLFLGLAAGALAGDWPQWLGPDRDGTWEEEGVLARFPDGGPEVLWRAPVGLGYSGPSVADGRVYLMDYRKSDGEIINNAGKAVPLKGRERVLCFDAATGDPLWVDAVDRDYQLSYPSGPRATVTVAGGKVYALGAMGTLRCLDARDGSLCWERNLVETYSPKFPIWGYAAHPLVHDGRVVTMVGGESSAVVALDADTGEESWTARSSEEPGYCPPKLIDWAGGRQLVVFTPNEVAGLDPASGACLWSEPLKPNFNLAIAAPPFRDGLLYASGQGRIGALMRLGPEGTSVERVWTGKPTTALYSVNATPMIVGEAIYGADVDTSRLIAVALEDGRRLWQLSEPVTGNPAERGRHGTVFLTLHEPSGRFYLFNETGTLIIATLTPEAFTELDRAKLIEPTNEAYGRKVVWSAPAFAGRSIFVRNDRELLRVDLSAE